MLNLLKHYTMKSIKNEKGQGMVEYALIIGLVAIVVVVALGLVGGSITDTFNSIVDKLGNVDV